MAERTRAQLKEWFGRGMYPTAEQFSDLIDSFRLGSEKIALGDVAELGDMLNGAYTRAEGEGLEKLTAEGLKELESLREDYDGIWRLKGAPEGFAPLDEGGKLPEGYLPAGARGAVWLRGICSGAEWLALDAGGREGRWFLSDRGEIMATGADGTEQREGPEGGIIYVDGSGLGVYVWTGTELRQLRGESGQLIVDHMETELAIEPGVLHRWGEVTSLTVDFAGQREGYAGEYCMEFTSGAEPTVLSLPASVKFPEDLEIEANMRYQVSVVNNVGLIVGVEK